jgi:hypothetical protein
MAGMELKLIGSKGIPEGSIVSIKVGTVRRQAPVGSDRPYRFSGLSHGKQQMKVDVYAPAAQARLLIEPCEAKCSVKLDASRIDAMDKLLDLEGMFLDFAVSGCQSDGSVAEGEANVVQVSRPSSAQSDRSAARRHQVALEVQPYFEQHNLMDVMQTLLQGMIKEKPDDPYSYMIRVLENSRNASAGAAQPVPRQRPSSAPSGPAAKTRNAPLQSALRPSSALSRGERNRGHRVSWSTTQVLPLSPEGVSQMPVGTPTKTSTSDALEFVASGAQAMSHSASEKFSRKIAPPSKFESPSPEALGRLLRAESHSGLPSSQQLRQPKDVLQPLTPSVVSRESSVTPRPQSNAATSVQNVAKHPVETSENLIEAMTQPFPSVLEPRTVHCDEGQTLNHHRDERTQCVGVALQPQTQDNTSPIAAASRYPAGSSAVHPIESAGGPGLEGLRAQLKLNLTKAVEKSTLNDLLVAAWDAGQQCMEIASPGPVHDVQLVSGRSSGSTRGFEGFGDEKVPPDWVSVGVVCAGAARNAVELRSDYMVGTAAAPASPKPCSEASVQSNWPSRCEVDSLREETVALRQRTEQIETLLRRLVAEKEASL